MSLFTAALAGVGRTAQDMAGTYIKTEAAESLERVRAQLDEQKARLVADLQMRNTGAAEDARLAADKERARFGTSPEMVAAEANKAGTIKRAEADNTAYTLNPGEQRRIGSEPVAENTRQTSAEATRTDRASAPKVKDAPNIDKLFKDGGYDFKDPTSGQVDAESRGVASSIVKRLIDKGLEPEQARDRAMQALQTAQTAAGNDRAKYRDELNNLQVAIGLKEAPPSPAKAPAKDYTAEANARAQRKDETARNDRLDQSTREKE
ncbi:MAG TPA: hypothetical protein VFS42_06855, partial [Burkholderiaceae bacterium]|nr:hypothetical protein [Burkholderiaceae bacterium]